MSHKLFSFAAIVLSPLAAGLLGILVPGIIGIAVLVFLGSTIGDLGEAGGAAIAVFIFLTSVLGVSEGPARLFAL